MPWIELHITTTAEHTNELSQQLTEFGANAITLKDAGDQPIYEPSATTPRIWAETIIVGLFEHDHPIEPVIAYLNAQKSQHALQTFAIHTVADEDWVRRSLDSFKPLCFGDRLWICPSWQTPPAPNAINVILDPGLAFGTGTHPTTSLCLEWLDQHVNNQALAIDYGCGSGILGIAAQKLGVRKIIAVDNDPQALIATLQNAEQNNLLPPVFTAHLSDVPLAETADIVLANILAKPLTALAKTLADLTKPQGYIVLSGILASQTEEINQAYEPWFDMQLPVFKEDWVRMVGIKRPAPSQKP
jgi:ribosomal protein L11 methyltransferase